MLPFDDNQNNVKRNVNVKKMETNEIDNYDYDSNDVKKLTKMFYLSIAYSANIGGTTTLTSNGPNLILRFILDSTFDGKAPLDYASWFFFNAPAVIVTIICVWFAFKCLYFDKVNIPFNSSLGKATINKKYQDLGKIKFSEYTVMFTFVCLVLLWMLRDPTFMNGWAKLFPDGQPRDATAVIFIISLLFIIPVEPTKEKFGFPLLNWDYTQQQIRWGIILLRGGGYSLATAVEASGLSKLIAEKLSELSFLSPLLFVITISILTAFVTEFASNSAVASVLLPIAVELAIVMKVNPLLLLVPITLSCSYAFILPVGTPANSLVFDHAKLETKEMISPGLVTQFIALFIMFINLFTMGRLIFDIQDFPSWATKKY